MARKAATKTAGPAAAPRRSRAAASARTVAERDAELLRLMSERTAAAAEVYHAADDPGRALFDAAADDAALRTLVGANDGPLPEAVVRRVFGELISAAKRQVRPTRVAYLGPEYSFSHLAAVQRFGESADLAPVQTIAAVFEEVNRGHVRFGMVPIENSTDGRVVDTLSMFTRLPVRICGEVHLRIHLHLLANGPRGGIVEVYSKPQALSQCRNWLAKNLPRARPVEVTSTSTAARLAGTKPGAAAVASERAAVEHGLAILAERIEDNPENVTRFAVIGEASPPPSGSDRTAVLLRISHEPGALVDALSPFKRNGVNLSWIESFPLPGPEPGYQFFLDFEGHADEPAVAKTLAALGKKSTRLELLGSYPRGEVPP